MSELIEKVARAICRKMWNEHYLQADMRLEDIVDGSWVEYTEEARAATAAVAEWLDPKQMPSLLANTSAEIISARLRNELEQPKGAAGDGR